MNRAAPGASSRRLAADLALGLTVGLALSVTACACGSVGPRDSDLPKPKATTALAAALTLSVASGPAAQPSAPSMEKLERIARKYKLSPQVLENIVKELAGS